MYIVKNRICRAPDDATGGAAAAGTGDGGDGGGGDAAAAAAAAAAAGGGAEGGTPGLLGGGEALPQKPDWATGMSDDSWTAVAANDYQSLDDLVGAHNSAQSKIGADKFVIPGENATPEDWDAAYTALGRPEAAAAYVIPMPEGVEASEGDLAFQESFKAKAHETGLNQQQVTALAEWNNELIQKAAVDLETAQAAEAEKTKAGLRQLYGAEADDKLNAANALLKNVAGEDVSKMFANSDLSRHLPTVEFMIKMAEMAGGEGGLVGVGDGASGAVSIEAQIKTAMADPIYNDPKLPGHHELRARVGRMRKLFNESKT